MKTLGLFIGLGIFLLFLSHPLKTQAGGGRIDFYFVSDHHSQYTGLPAWLPEKPIQLKIVAWEDSSRVKKSVGEKFDVKLMNEEIGDYCKMTQNVTNDNGEAYAECSFHSTKQGNVKLLEIDKQTEGQMAMVEIEYNLPPSRSSLLTPTITKLLLPTSTPILPTLTPTLTPSSTPLPTIPPTVATTFAQNQSQNVKPTIFQKIINWLLRWLPHSNKQ